MDVDREADGHGQLLATSKAYLKMSYSTFGYGGAYASSGAQVGLSSSPISYYTATAPQCPIFTLSLINPRVPTWAVIKVRAGDGV